MKEYISATILVGWEPISIRIDNQLAIAQFLGATKRRDASGAQGDDAKGRHRTANGKIGMVERRLCSCTWM